MPSPDPFSDETGTVSQDRHLTNYGVKTDLSYVTGPHNLKFGGTLSATALTEHFTLGLTDPTVNSPCLDAGARQWAILRSRASTSAAERGSTRTPTSSRAWSRSI